VTILYSTLFRCVTIDGRPGLDGIDGKDGRDGLDGRIGATRMRFLVISILLLAGALIGALLCGPAKAQPAVVPGPTLLAAPVPPEVTSVKFSDNLIEQATPCTMRKLADGKSCPECDLTLITAIGRHSLTMKSYGGAGTSPSPDSAPLLLDISKGKCGKANAFGVVNCALLYTPVAAATPAIGACTPAVAADVFKTPTSGTLRIYATSSGKLASAIVGRTAPPSTTCDCTAKIFSGTATYCPIAGGASSEVTLCVKSQ
jgi:hypothetical protein